MAAFDYKKAEQQLYLPKEQPVIVDVPQMQFVAVEGEGDPNVEDGAYSAALTMLYALSFTIKMSEKNKREIKGYFPYVLPPLEGFWWMANGSPGVDYANKAGFHWLAVIRLPEFVTPDIFAWAKEEAAKKKKIDMSATTLLTLREGLCVQCMHTGSYDAEPATVAKMDRFIAENGYVTDFSPMRRHHEIYLNDPRRTAPEKLKTVIRHPIRLK